MSERDRSEQLYRTELAQEFQRLTPEQQRTLWRESRSSPEARQQLLLSVLPLVMSAVRRGTRRRGFHVNDVDMMDLIQEGNIRAIKALDSWQPDRAEGATLAGWVYLHVEKPLWRDLRPIMDEQDSRQLSTDFALGYDADGDAEGTEYEAEVPDALMTPVDGVETEVDRARVREVVRTLPRELLEVVRLTHWHGLSSREIGELTGLSHATVSRRLQQAHDLIREQLRQKSETLT